MTRKKKALVGLVVAAFVFMAGDAGADPTTAATPQVGLGETRCDFGTVVEGSPVSCEFVIANKGTAPLRILEMKSG